MTAPARITQADMERAAKAVKSAGFERARIVMDLEKGRIEVIIGENHWLGCCQPCDLTSGSPPSPAHDVSNLSVRFRNWSSNPFPTRANGKAA